jgi:peptide/nickel transport system substrate-binding protein
VLGLTAAACGSGPVPADETPSTFVSVPGGSITVGIDRTPTGCNPNTPGGDTWANSLVLAPVLPSAFTTSDGGQSVGNDALLQGAELVSTSPQTVVYTLNAQAVWSDGVPVSAQDFIYAWKQQRGAAADLAAGASPVGGQAATIQGYRDIKSVTAGNGGRTVTVVFRTPFSDWQMLFHNLLPAHVMEKVGWNPPCTGPDPAIDLSAGPFVLHAVSPDRYTLIKNPRWWGAPVQLDRITIAVGRGPGQLASWVVRHRATIVQPQHFGPAYLHATGGDPGLNGHMSISSTFLQLVFSVTSPATTDLRVRQALADAVDRQELVDQQVAWADPNIVPAASHLYSQVQDPYPGTAPPSDLPNSYDAAKDVTTTTTSPGNYDPAAPWPTRNQPAATGRLLGAEGFTQRPDGTWLDPDGQPFVLRLAVDGADPWAAATAEQVDDQLTRAGFPVDPTTYPDLAQAGQALAAGQADLAVLPYTAGAYPTQAMAWFTTLLGPPGQDGSEDWSNYDSATFTSLVTQAAHLFNPVTAQPLYDQADKLLWSDMVTLPLFAEPSVLTWSDRLAGAGPNPYGAGLLWYPESWSVDVLESVTQASSSPA